MPTAVIDKRLTLPPAANRVANTIYLVKNATTGDLEISVVGNSTTDVTTTITRGAVSSMITTALTPYATTAQLTAGLNGKSNTGHTHAVSEVTGLSTRLNDIEAALAGKAAAVHTHAPSAITGLDTLLAGKAPTNHTHTIAQVTNLQAELDGKAAAVHTHAMGDVTGLATALAGKAATTHTHTSSQISDSSALGRSLLTATTEASARTLIGAGTSNLVIGTTASTAKAGNWTPSVSDVTGLQAVLDALPKGSNALDTIDINTLGARSAEGFYYQAASANATLARGYPLTEAGSLQCANGPYGCQQEYTGFASGRKFVRGLSGNWNGSNGPWNTWKEIFLKPAGTTAQYVRGDGTLAAFPTAFPISTITGLQTALDGKQDIVRGPQVNALSGTATYALVAADALKMVRSAANRNITIPAGLGYPFRADIFAHTGEVTLVPASGVTVSTTKLKIPEGYAVSILSTAANVFDIIGFTIDA